MPRPDEGLIHAWLDGQLPPEEASRIEELVATDAEWAAAAAEARGLVAASSRILSALDHVPANVIPIETAARATRRLPWWTKVAAAVVVVTGSTVVVMRQVTAPERALVAVSAPAPKQLSAPSVAGAGNIPAAKQAPMPTVVAGVARSEVLPAAPAPMRAPEVAPTEQLMERRVARATVPPASAANAMAADAAPRAFAEKDVSPTARNAEQIVTRGTDLSVAARARPQAGAEPSVAASKGSAVPDALSGPCYRVRKSNSPTDEGMVMRAVRIDGDTLRLQRVQGKASMRAWVIWRDGKQVGALMVADDGSASVSVVATPVACPAP